MADDPLDEESPVPTESSKSLLPFPSPAQIPTSNQAWLIIFALVSSNMFALLIGWIFEFLSLRGVVDVAASRIALVGAWITGVIIVCAFAWGKGIVAKGPTVIGGAVLLAGALWVLDMWAPKPLPSPVAVYIDCSPEPLPVPILPGSTAHVMHFSMGDPPGILLVNVASSLDRLRPYPGASELANFTETSSRTLGWGIQCHISNHGPMLLEKVSVKMPLLFFKDENVHQRNRDKQIYGVPVGVVPLKTAFGPIAVSELDSRAHFDFYAINTCPAAVVHLDLPDTAEVKVFGESKVRIVRLDRNDANPLIREHIMYLPALNAKWKGAQPCD